MIGGFGAWYALGAVAGWTDASVAPSAPQGGLLLGPATLLVALLLHAAVQQVVFFRVVPKNAAEGLHARGVAPSRAVAVSVLVAIPFFVAIHDVRAGLRLLDLAVAGGVFGLLYLHTGSLGLGIGAHLGALYAGNLVVAAPGATVGPTLLRVTGSLPGVLGTVDRYGFPKLLAAYLLVLAWLRWRRGELPVERTIARTRQR